MPKRACSPWGVVAHFEKNPNQLRDIHIPLKPGQTYSLQVFDLEDGVDFSADSESATPTTPIEIEYTVTRKRIASPGYYDADITFGAIQGSGAETVLPTTITINGVAEGEPKRAATSQEDYLIMNGLDAQGDVVASVWLTVFPVIDAGETRVVNVPLGGGNSSGVSYVMNPASDFLKAVSFEVVEFSPSATHRK